MPFVADLRKRKRRRWLVPLIVIPTCVAISLGFAALLAIGNAEGAALLLLPLAGLVSGIVCGSVWIRAGSADNTAERASGGTVLLGWLVGLACGVITFVTAAGIALAWLSHVFATANFN